MSSERILKRHGGGHGCDVDTRADTATVDSGVEYALGACESYSDGCAD